MGVSYFAPYFTESKFRKTLLQMRKLLERLFIRDDIMMKFDFSVDVLLLLIKIALLMIVCFFRGARQNSDFIKFIIILITNQTSIYKIYKSYFIITFWCLSYLHSPLLGWWLDHLLSVGVCKNDWVIDV